MPPDDPSQSGMSARRHFEAAVALHKQGKFDDAERHYRSVLRLHRDHLGTLHGLALVLVQTGRLAEAAKTYKHLVAVSPDDAVAHANLGHVLHSMGHYEEALASLERARALKPDSAETYTNIGNALAKLNRPQEALAFYAKASALNPRLAEPYNNSGNLLASLGRHDEALAQFQRALPVQPDRALAHFNLGTALGALNRHEEAVTHYRMALTERPEYPAALNNLGNSLHALLRPAESLEAFERLLALNPENAAAHFGAGNALQVLGRVDEARQTFERAAELAPDVALIHHALVETKRVREDDPQLAVMEDLAQRIASLAKSEQIELHFALAKAYDDIGRTERAFEHLQSGNTLKRRSIVYDETAELDALRALERVFTSEMMEARRGLGDPSEVPVFIVGMPRSGTTLVEQILASHPRMFGAGELLHLPELVSTIHAGARFPADFSSLSAEQLRQFASRYVERLQSHAPDADRIADKLPANFRFAGLIHLVLPKARIIHVRRDPVDTCFSCYTKLFPPGQDYTFDLGELGRYYRAYESLMEHWRSVLPAGAMLEVHYETVVADLEGQAWRMIEYCGLEWDERCLRFHETERSVRTASFAQVHMPLYGNSIGRWRPYRAHLRLLLDTLGVDGD